MFGIVGARFTTRESIRSFKRPKPMKASISGRCIASTSARLCLEQARSLWNCRDEKAFITSSSQGIRYSKFEGYWKIELSGPKFAASEKTAQPTRSISRTIKKTCTLKIKSRRTLPSGFCYYYRLRGRYAAVCFAHNKFPYIDKKHLNRRRGSTTNRTYLTPLA